MSNTQSNMMDFGSEYILNEEETEEEESLGASASVRTSKETHNDDYSGFECEIMDFEAENEAHFVEKEKKINTNTVQVELKRLQETADVIVEKSKYVTCKSLSCRAVYSHLAKMDADKKVWICNFCNEENDIHFELPDLSGKTDVMYIEDISHTPELKASESSELKVIFVIDTSSSMGMTKEMDITIASPALKKIIASDNQKQLQIQQQYLSPEQIQQLVQNTNNIEVSRLQAVKSDVLEVVERLSKSEQNGLKVGLVTFHDNVNVYGDGSKNVVVEGGQLADIGELQKIGIDNADLLPLSQSVDILKRTIENLEDIGCTALGPALIIAQRMASFARGSKIILCTDGIANIGVGKLEETTNTEIDSFYSDVIANSIALGVSVSIICVDNAGLSTKLGQVPIETGGSLEKIQATEIGKKLLEELSRATVAVNADISFVVHKDLYVNDTGNKESQLSQHTQTIGNLLLDKKLSFGFSFKTNSPQQSSQGQALSQASENVETKTIGEMLPFQVQIRYINLSDVEVVRVWTAERKITSNRAQAEEAMNLKMVVENFIQRSSQQMLDVLYARQDVVNPANNISLSGSPYLSKIGRGDPETHLKLSNFIALLVKIVKTRRITEDQIAELNKLKDARVSQVQG